MSTETGWVYSTIPGTDWGGEAVQGRYLPKTFVRGIAAGLVTTNWYAMLDADPSQPGILGGSYRHSRCGKHIKRCRQLSQQLGAAKYQRALTQAETGSSSWRVTGLPITKACTVRPDRCDLVRLPGLDRRHARPAQGLFEYSHLYRAGCAYRRQRSSGRGDENLD